MNGLTMYIDHYVSDSFRATLKSEAIQSIKKAIADADTIKKAIADIDVILVRDLDLHKSYIEFLYGRIYTEEDHNLINIIVAFLGDVLIELEEKGRQIDNFILYEEKVLPNEQRILDYSEYNAQIIRNNIKKLNFAFAKLKTLYIKILEDKFRLTISRMKHYARDVRYVAETHIKPMFKYLVDHEHEFDLVAQSSPIICAERARPKEAAEYIDSLMAPIDEQINSPKPEFQDTMAMIKTNDNWQVIGILLRKATKIIATNLQFLRESIKFTRIELKKFEVDIKMCVQPSENFKNFMILFDRLTNLKKQFVDTTDIKMNLDVLDEMLREINANDSLRKISVLVSVREQIEENAIHLQQVKQVVTKNEILKTNIDSFEQQLCTLDSIDSETFMQLEKRLNDLEQESKTVNQSIIDKPMIEESIHSATSECEKLILAARVVKAIDELNEIINREQEKINTESKMQSHRERITIAIIITSCAIMSSVTAIFFTIKELLRFSMQVSIAFCSAGLITIIIALTYLIRQNFHIELIESLEERNSINREKINLYTRSLDSLESNSTLEEWKRQLPNDLIQAS